MSDDETVTELEERIRDAEVEKGVRSAVPADPTDLPHDAGEYYMRHLEHVEGEGHYPYAEERFKALEKERAKGP